MRHRIAMITLLLGSSVATMAQTLQWANGYFTTSSSSVLATTIDNSGNVFAVGVFQGTTDFDPGPGVTSFTSTPPNGFVTKTAANGTLLWVKRFSCTGNLYAQAVSVDGAGDVYVAGYFTTSANFNPDGGGFPLSGPTGKEAFVCKISSAGVFQWAIKIGGNADDEALCIDVNTAGVVTVGGKFRSTSMIYGNGSSTTTYNTSTVTIDDMFLARLATTGAISWFDQLSGSGYEEIRGVYTDNTGECLIAAYGNQALDMNPTAATNMTTGAGSVVAKYNASGGLMWFKDLYAAAPMPTYALTIDAQQNILVCGTMSNVVVDFDPGPGVYNLSCTAGSTWVWKLNSAGNFVWARLFGGTGNATLGLAIATDPGSNVYVTGHHTGTTDFNPGAGVFNITSSAASVQGYLNKMDASGNFVTAMPLVTNSQSQLPAVAVNANYEIVLGGVFYGNTDVDPTSGVLISNVGTFTGLLLKINQCVPTTSSITTSACNSYTLNSQTYTTSGTYTQNLVNVHGCDSTLTLNLTVRQPSSATLTVSACNSYTINSQTYTTSGTYVQTLTNTQGCDSTLTLNLTIHHVTATSSSTPILCNGGVSAVTVNGSGGTAPYSGTGNFNVPAGTYTYVITDANGCSANTSITITQPLTLVAAAAATTLSCYGDSAFGVVFASGGTTPYVGDTGFYLPAGSYSFTVTDDNGCTSTASLTITQPPQLIANTSSTPIVCNGGSSTVSVSGTGGTSPYTGTGNYNVTAGNYNYVITDAAGCTANASVTITEPLLLTSSANASAVACNGGNAVVTVSGAGGTAPYSGTGNYTVTAGPYNYTITDANGCTSTTSVVVTQPSQLVLNVSVNPVLCNGGNGTVIIGGAGGTSPYTGEGMYAVAAGTYNYILTDSNGCTVDTNVTVTEPALLAAVVTSVAHPTTCGGSDGSIDITVSGGTAPVTFLWSNSVSTEDVMNLNAGAYSCNITDDNGCTTTVSSSLNDPNAPSVTFQLTSDTVCLSDAAFVLTGASPAGGTFSGPGVTSNSFDPSMTGTGVMLIGYTYTDLNGCSGSAVDSIFVDVCTDIQLTGDESALHVFPNPGSGDFTVQIAGETITETSVYDATGKLIQAQKYKGEQQLNLHIETKGMYLLRITTANGNVQQTVVVIQ